MNDTTVGVILLLVFLITVIGAAIELESIMLGIALALLVILTFIAAGKHEKLKNEVDRLRARLGNVSGFKPKQ